MFFISTKEEQVKGLKLYQKMIPKTMTEQIEMIKEVVTALEKS